MHAYAGSFILITGEKFTPDLFGVWNKLGVINILVIDFVYCFSIGTPFKLYLLEFEWNFMNTEGQWCT